MPITKDIINLSRLRLLLDESGMDVLIALSPENVLYLSGALISTQRDIRERLALVVWPSTVAPSFLVCNIEETQAREDSWIEDVRSYVEFATSPVALLAEVLTEQGFAGSAIGIELGYLSTRYYRELEALLPEARIVDCGPLFDDVRMVKTPAEIERLRDAARRTEAVIRHAYADTRPGDTEKVIAQRMHAYLIDDGADSVPFNVLAAGANTLRSHHHAGGYQVRDGDVLRVDFGGLFDGYYSDLARMAALGTPSTHDTDCYARLIDVHHQLIAATRPGTTAREVYEVGKRAYAQVGLPFARRPHFGHSLGVGLHERPLLQPFEERVLEPNMVLCIEPAFSDPGHARYHIEDLVQVTERGNILLSDATPTDSLFVISS